MSFFHKGILILWFSGKHAREREPLLQGRAREYPTVEPAGHPRRFAVSQLARLESTLQGLGIRGRLGASLRATKVNSVGPRTNTGLDSSAQGFGLPPLQGSAWRG
jgi:hypothetical protein